MSEPAAGGMVSGRERAVRILDLLDPESSMASSFATRLTASGTRRETLLSIAPYVPLVQSTLTSLGLSAEQAVDDDGCLDAIAVLLQSLQRRAVQPKGLNLSSRRSRGRVPRIESEFFEALVVETQDVMAARPSSATVIRRQRRLAETRIRQMRSAADVAIADEIAAASEEDDLPDAIASAIGPIIVVGALILAFASLWAHLDAANDALGDPKGSGSSGDNDNDNEGDE